MMPTRMVALGYQGFGNLGDEAILTGIEALLAGSDLTVTAILGGDRAPISGFKAAERITSAGLWPSLSGARRLAQADALLISGGGLLHDHWRSVVPRYLAWVILARLLHRRVAWLGVGVGPLNRRLSRWLAGRATRLSHVVLVRDEASARLIGQIGGRVDGVVPDPAFFNPVAPISDSRSLAGPRPLGLIVRAPAPGGQGHEAALLEALVGCAAHLGRTEGRATLVATFAGLRDRDFAERIAQRISRAGSIAVDVDELPADPATGVAWLARCDAVVSVRLHGLILAALAGVPFAGIAYDDKVEGVLQELGAQHLTIPLAGIGSQRLYEALAVARTPAERRRIADAVASMRARRSEVVQLLAATLH